MRARGGLRALAVTSAQRQPAIQEVAPIAESGVPGTSGFLAMAWQSLVAPAGTPEDAGRSMRARWRA
ncbi:MAG: tripartite tricarboxylate transporter substrate-binding protein [Rubrivivax sp.]